MSTYEQDREDRAVGPELCDECDHPLRLHGPEGCEFERGDRWVDGESMGAWVAGGPCGCQAATIEPLEGQELLRELFQRILAYSYSTARARNLAAYLQNSSPLVGKHKLDVSWSDL